MINPRDRLRPFDIIGDIHGCFGELCELLEQLGWTLVRTTSEGAVHLEPHPDNRTLVFLGDLVDRGPDTPSVLRLAMAAVRDQLALCIRGNHEDRLVRVLREISKFGADALTFRLDYGLDASLSQILTEPAEFATSAIEFIDGLVPHYILDDGKLVVAHAGLPQRYHGVNSTESNAVAIYGETSDEVDDAGYPVRVDWASSYRGHAMVVYGHSPVALPVWVNNTLCIDTGCAYGGELSALRYPELEIVSVKSRQS